MNKSNEVFEIIKSMTMSEKRYFKIYASRHVMGEKNNYIRLFEVIDKMKVYDEKSVRKKFSNESFIKQLSVAKNYLYGFILKSMRAYYDQTSIVSQLKAMLADIDFLYNKGLHDKYRRTIKKAKEFAYKYEQFPYVLELLDWERKTIFDYETDIKNAEIKYKNIFQEREDILAKIKNIADYLIIADNLLMNVNWRGIARNKKDENKYKKMIDNKLLKDINFAKTTRSKVSYYNSFAFYYGAIQDHSAGLIHRKKMFDFIDSKKEYVEANKEIYISALNNLIIGYAQQKKYVEATYHLKLLKKYEVNTHYLKARKFQSVAHLGIYIDMSTFQYQNLMQFIPEVERGLRTYEGNVNTIKRMMICYNIAYIYIICAKFNEALIWINKLMNDQKINIRHDVMSTIRILNIIIHFELKNYELLEYAVISAYRFLLKKQYANGVEMIFLDFIRNKFPAADKKEQIIESFISLKKSLIFLSKNPHESPGLETFDFISWLTSKIENRSFVEVLKEKAKKNLIN